MTMTVTSRRNHLDCQLPSAPAAPLRAREALDTVDELAQYPDLRFAAQLLASELVTNCIRHVVPGGEPISLLLDWDERTLHAEVADHGAGFDVTGVLAGYRQRNERHRGLSFVDALADRWGFRGGDGGFCIWFELDLVPGRRPWRGRERIRPGPRGGS